MTAFTISPGSWKGPAYGQYVGRAGEPSPVLQILSHDAQAAFSAAPVAGAVRYFNPYAARIFGLPVPPGHHVTSEFEASLVARYCVRSVVPSVPPQGPSEEGAPDTMARYYPAVVNIPTTGEPISLTATKFSQTEGHKGDGRGGTFADGNCFLKGVGVTALTTRKADDRHTGGAENTRWSVIDAIRLEIAANLFSRHGIRPIAIFGLGVFYPIGDWFFQNPRRLGLDEAGLLLRGGLHARNAIFVEQARYTSWIATEIVPKVQASLQIDSARAAQDARERWAVAGTRVHEDHDAGTPVQYGEVDPNMFVRAARALDLLRFRTVDGEVLPDLAATLEGILDLVAQSCAEQYRWGEAHGTPSFGNYSLDGSHLDPVTISGMPRRGTMATNPGTAPWGIGEGRELYVRSEAVRLIYDTLVGNLDSEARRRFNLPDDLQFTPMFYQKLQGHLRIQLLRATGLKPAVVARLSLEHSDEAQALADVMLELAELENPGPPVRIYARYPDYPLNAEKALEEKSVVDLFGALAALAEGPVAEGDDLVRYLLRALKPVYKGADIAAQRAKVVQRARTLLRSYDRVMQIVRAEYAEQYYGDVAAMETAMARRARFENRHGLYVWDLKPPLRDLAAQANDAGHGPLTDRARVTRMVRDTVAKYSRNVEALLRQPDIVEGNDWVELGATYDWITQGVRINTDTGDRFLFVRIPLHGEDDSATTPELFGRSYTRDELARSVFEVGTTIAQPQFVSSDEGQDYVEYLIPARPSDVGVLHGAIQISSTDGLSTETLVPYAHAFAVPDDDDLQQIMTEHRSGVVW